jgi:fimbrial chaperone protein
MKSAAASLKPIFLAGLAALWCACASAGEFVVNPIRLELGSSTRSGVITVRNESKDKLSFQMQAMEWTQDAQGQDVYVETQELIFFPKLMTVAAGEESVIRIGARMPVTPREKTYRLFIEELPGAAAAATIGPQLTVLIRFGAPIFVKPVKAEDRLDLESVEMAGGELSLTARNTGNQHQLVEGIHLKGTDSGGREVYALTLADRYLLAGTRKRYTTTVPRDQCARITQLSIEFKTDKATQGSKLAVGRGMCP